MAESQEVVEQGTGSEDEIAGRIADMLGGGEQKKSLPPLGVTPQPAEEEAQAPEEENEPGEQEQEAESTPDEEFDFDFEGETYKLPAKLKPLTEAQMRQADYTRKTQELADHRRFVETQAKQLQMAAQFQAEAQREFSELGTLNSKLEQFKNVDWSKLWESDPVEAGKLRIMRDEIKDARDRLTSELSQKQQSFQHQQKQQLGELISKGREILQREIKGWSEDLAKSIRTNAEKSYGFTAEELGTVVDPRMVKLMHDAYQFNRMKQANLTQKLVPPSAKTIKPGAATNTQQQRTGKVTEARDRLKKSGSVDDAAGLLMARWR